jgi:hypothetical protein
MDLYLANIEAKYVTSKACLALAYSCGTISSVAIAIFTCPDLSAPFAQIWNDELETIQRQLSSFYRSFDFLKAWHFAKPFDLVRCILQQHRCRESLCL